MAYLRNAGIVSARRDGKWMHYRMVTPDDAGAAAILETTLRVVKGDRMMQSDLARLDRACCAPQRFVTLQGAPVPVGVGEGAV